MSSDFVRCCVCFSDYDLEDHVAVVLSQCGHNVCQICAEKLIESQNECPICRKVFSTDDDTLYAPNRLIQEQLERENQYERCRLHANHLLELYCYTDKCKICLECHFNKGEGGHRGHEVERIADFKEQLDQKRELFEVREEKYQAMYDEGKSLLGKRRQEQLDNFKSVERITKLVVFETYLGIKTVFDEEESKLEEQYGEESSLRQEIKSKIDQYSDIKKADFSVVLDEDTEKLAEDFDKPKLAEYYQRLKTRETMQSLNMSRVTQHGSKISIEATSLSQVRLKSYLTFRMEGGSLIITASDTLNEKVCIDLNKWEKELKGINIVFDKFNFNHDDLLLLEYIWVKLQPQTHLVGLEYRNTKNSESTTQFEDHLYAFPRIIFSDPRNLKAIDLKFVEAKGSDRYTKLLTEKYLAEASQLASLKLTYEDTDLGDDTFKNLVKNSKVLLKSLTQLSLTFRKIEEKKVFPSLEHVFVLPNLKEFALNADFPYNFLAYQWFLSTSLKYMNGLTKCELELKSSGMSGYQLDTLFQNFHKMPDLGTLIIAIPELEVSPAKFQEFFNFANRMKEPKDLKLDLKITVPNLGLNSIANAAIHSPNISRLRDLRQNSPFEHFYNPPQSVRPLHNSQRMMDAMSGLRNLLSLTPSNSITNANNANVSTNPAVGTGQSRQGGSSELRWIDLTEEL